jgi:ssDNA thymidine ADP-ribosyltransferase, DarT
MYQPPARPKIYHIVHIDKLPSIIADGCLSCDAKILRRPHIGTVIGMNSIKQRRLRLPVHCHPGLYVGDFVPFYFCPRSIMLYVIHCANHEELAYRGGQGSIVHLEADFHDVIGWADARRRQWAFSLSNAGAAYTKFRSRLDELNEVNWPAVAARNFRPAEVKEGKQAEFLVCDSFPWECVMRIGVHSREIARQVSNILPVARHRPPVEVRPDWYY